MSAPFTDDEVLTDFKHRTRRFLRRSLLSAICVFLYVFACSILWGLADRYGWLARYRIDSGVCIFIELLPIQIWIMFSARKTDQPRLDHLPDSILRRMIDHYQLRWRQVVGVLLTLLVGSAVWIVRTYAADAAPMPPQALGWLLFCALICALSAIFYPGLKVFDDERMQALRGRTTKAAYVCLLIAAGIAAVAIVTAPRTTALALTGLISVAGACPAIFYIVADWRAGREE